MAPPDDAPARHVESWCARLTATDPGAATWAAFDDLPEATRRDVALALKARVDALVRSQPRAAVAVAEVLLRATAGLQALRPVALRGRGVAAHFTGDAATATAAFEEAAELYEQSGEATEAARALRSLIDVHQMAGRRDAALEVAGRARDLLEGHDEPRLLGQIDLNVGNVHTRLADYAAADRHYRSARAAFERLDDDLGLAYCDFNLAVVAMNANQLARARRHWASARERFVVAGMTVPVADCDYHQAYLESRRGRFERAVQGLERARQTYEQNGKPSGVPLCDLDLAEVHLRLGARRDALARARSAADGFAGLDMEYERARAEILAGSALAELGDERAAADSLDRAELRLRRLDNRVFASFARLQRCRIELEAGRLGLSSRVATIRAELRSAGALWMADIAGLVQARALLQEEAPQAALECLEILDDGARDDGLLSASTHHLRALGLQALDRHDEALDELQAAADTIDGTWNLAPGGDLRLAFFGSRQAVFEDLASLHLRAGRSGAALIATERGRSRSLHVLERVQRAPGWLDEREHLDWLLSRQLDRELGRLVGGGELRDDADGGAALEHDVAASRQRLGALSRVEGGDSAATVFDEQGLVAALGADETALVYGRLAGRLHVMLVERRGAALDVRAHALDVDEAQLRRWRDLFRFQLSRRRLDPRAGELLQRLAVRLGAALLGPLELTPGRPLVVVPFGVIHDLPVHALVHGGRPLAAAHDVSCALSLAHLARLRQRRPADEDICWCTSAPLETLPAVEREVDGIEGRLGPRARRLAPSELVDRLHREGLRGRLLHVAGHGQYAEERPRFSGICLGDRFLLAHDLAGMSVDVDLVTLSGCQTGRRFSAAGDELIGLPRALLGAGAGAVVGSLWSVADEHAAAFMDSFYDHLGRGADARTALGRARGVLREQTDDLAAWAAFSLIGDPGLRITSDGHP